MSIWYNMETLKTQIRENKAKLFREIAMERYGHSKGSISKALNEAIDIWLEKLEGKKRTIKARELTGIASSSKDSSHQAHKKAVRLMASVG